MSTEEKIEDLQYIDINMQIVADYISEKYLLTATVDEYDTVYVMFDTGRMIITYEELLDFLNNNQLHYIASGWAWTDLVDVYFIYCLTSALNKLVDSIYHNSDKILH